MLARTVCALALAALLPLAPVAADPAPAPPMAQARDAAREAELARAFAADVAVLAGDEMEGRGITTAGIRRAADWIEARLRTLGLQPAFGRSYRQGFPIKTGVALKDGNVLGDLPADAWTPLGMSSSGAFEGELAFVGYGIEAPAIGYQELEGLDLTGKVLLMLRYEPQEKDEASPFSGRRPSRFSALRYRVHQARERGAAAVVFVTGPLQDEGKDKLPALKNDGPESPAGLPVVQVRLSVAQAWLKGAGVDLRAFQEAVDRDLKPRSVASTGVRLKGNVALEPITVQAENVAGLLPGRGPLASEVAVVGAHYDHLGMGGERSLRPNEVAIHNGADDNASGSVAVLLAAKRLKAALAAAPSHRSVVFVLFSGEEVGLAGSSAFVEHPPFPLARTVAMVNLDMVGRLRDDQLVVFGTDSATEWDDVLARAARDHGLQIRSQGDGYGPSDQTPFYAAGVPVLHLFTGTHELYHTPDDDPGTLDAAGAARVALLTADLAGWLASQPARPSYVRSPASAPREGDSRGHGAWLGTVPDFRAMGGEGGGVLVGDVRAGGPADRAGVKAGDRLVQLAGTRLDNLYDMTYALQDHRPGETVDVVVLRGGERLTLRATLGERGREGGRPPAMPAPAAEGKPGQPVAAPAPAPAMPPAMPPAMAAAGATASRAFYADRPGAAFEVEAGKPFPTAFEGERHLRDVRQLTFGGENAEAYWSPDGRSLIYQATGPQGCDQQYVLDLASGETRLVSSGKGRTTCGYFDWPEADRVVYASTEAAGEACPAPPDRSQGYFWAVYDAFDLWEARPDGTGQRRLTDSPGYDAEATWCHRGGKLVFTSIRSGDLELWEMDEAGGQLRQLTSTPGYDGGAFYSPDCSEIVWRASRPQGPALAEYRRLLGQRLISPLDPLDLFVMKADGSDVRQLTHAGVASFCPYFHPDGQRVIYASNVGAGPREFDLWMVGTRGGEPERVTTAPGFDGFPMFSPDGRFLVWGSNRANPQARDTNLFLARWVE